MARTSKMKVPQPKKVSNLALYGGKPIRKKMLPYNTQSVDASDRAAVDKALRGELITRGPVVAAFERSVAEMVEMPHAVAFSSATAALHAVMALIGAKPGARVVTSPITFAATSNAVLYCEGEVSFQDVESSTMNLDLEKLQGLDDAIAVACVDYAGNPCRYDRLQELQKKYGFRSIADAAHSFGGSYRGKPVGSLAEFNILSFHPVKSITTGEGGMVVLKDPHEAEFLRAFKGHGIIRTAIPGYYRQEFLGFNYHITDLQCALGLSQLKKLKKFVKRRTEIAEAYQDFFSKMKELSLPQLSPHAVSSWHLYPLRLPLQNLSASREDILRALHAENIGANVHYIPVYWHPYYEKLGFHRGLCPQAEAEYLREISLPIFPGMNTQDIRSVCQGVQKVLEAFWI